MCQMRNGKIETFIKRYADLDRQIQRVIDLEPAEFYEYERRKERMTNVKKFINCLTLEIKTEASSSRHDFLNEAYQEALEEKKVFFDKERERSRLAEQLQWKQIQQAPFKKPISYESRVDTIRQRERPTIPTTLPTCNYCKKHGHSEDKCFSKQNQEKRQNFQYERPHSKDPPRKTYTVEGIESQLQTESNPEECFYPLEGTDTNLSESDSEDINPDEAY